MSRGEGAIRKMLPKAYLRKLVAHEAHLAMTFFKDLVPTMEEYVYNDGTMKTLMSLKGTVPIMRPDATYNIPVCLWIEDNYPHTAPFCYVRPTPDMMILRGNHVSSNGEVLLPYLDEWSNDCDLLSLLQVMVAMFGETLPLVMRPHPAAEQGFCRPQSHREAEARAKVDGSSYLSLTTEDGQPFLPQHETNC